MTAADLLTAGYFDEWMRVLFARMQQAAATEPTKQDNVLYSYKKLAQVLDVTVETMSAWVNKGKKVDGRVVKLQVFRFTSEPRVPWLALLAYHRGEDFDLDSLPAPLLLPPAELQPAPFPVLTTIHPHLRVAS